MGWVDGERNLVSYADGGRIAGWDHEWVQDALMVTVEMLRMMGLKTNTENTKYMFFTPGFI